LVEPLAELAAQVEVAVAAVGELREIDGVVGRNKAGHAGGHGRVEQALLQVDNHLTQPRQG
jgi:hypothetical protein